jgi:hypothetical protein
LICIRLDLGTTEGQANTFTRGKPMLMTSSWGKPFGATAVAIAILASTFILFGSSPSPGDTNDDAVIAESLAAMLRAGRTVVSRHQTEINDPAVGDKGLTGTKMLAEAAQVYRDNTKTDPNSIDLSTRHGRLLHWQMESIAEVVDANQETINKKGVAFKGFIPSAFGRLVNEAFGRKATTEAEMKVTAPTELIRNIKARPDVWELQVISEKFLQPSWPKGKDFSAVVENKGRMSFRMAVPEYYAASCLSCHGGPKGDIDVTGYPKEGRSEGDLGGVISITLYR